MSGFGCAEGSALFEPPGDVPATNDRDGDGLEDDLDECPDDGDKTAPGLCGCGAPDADSDTDGVLDCADLCPDDPDKTAPDACDCGVPVVDSDSNGTADCLQPCLGQPDSDSDGVCDALDEDDDGDGWLDVEELECGTDPVLSTSVPPDADGDGVCELAISSPYLGIKQTIPGVIEVENYDEGGLGVAYHDATATNPSAIHRPDFVEFSAIGTGFAVGNIAPGEWFKYTIDVEETGYYSVEFRVASSWRRNRRVHLVVDGDFLVAANVPDTVNWEWATVVVNDVFLEAGSDRELMMFLDCVRMSINWVNFKKM